MDGFTVGVVVVVVAIGVGILVHDSVSRRRRVRRIAREMLERRRQLDVEKHEYREVEASDFPHLDLRRYDEATATLRLKGFSKLGDIENVTLSRVCADVRTLQRVLVDKSGTIGSTVYQLKVKGLAAKRRARRETLVDFGTEFTDGCFLVTTNARSVMTEPSQLMLACLPSELSVTRILKIHERRIQGYQEENPGAQAIRFRSLEDALNSADRLTAARFAYRKSIGGGYLKEEMERLWRGDPDDLYDLKAVGQSVFREMQKLLRPEKNKAGG